jgi:hypothetical protein
VWGSHLFHRLASLQKTQISEIALRAPLPPTCHRDHHCPTCQLKTSSTYGPSAPSRQHQDLAHLNFHYERATRPPPTLPLVETRLRKRRSKEDATPMVLPSPSNKLDWVFTSRLHASGRSAPIVLSPAGRTTPEAATTTTTSTSTSEDFRPGLPYAQSQPSSNKQTPTTPAPPLSERCLSTLQQCRHDTTRTYNARHPPLPP